MGTEVLRPQDLIFGDKFGVSFHRRKDFLPNGTATVNRKQIRGPGSSSKKSSPKADKKKTNDTARLNNSSPRSSQRRKDDAANRSPPLGHVTILRRGESLDSLTFRTKGSNPKSEKKPADDLTVFGTGSIRSELEELSPRQILLSRPSYGDGYAGSGFAMSPSPRSLPLPSFFNKKQQNDVVVDDSITATRDLRRLLRLD